MFNFLKKKEEGSKKEESKEKQGVNKKTELDIQPPLKEEHEINTQTNESAKKEVNESSFEVPDFSENDLKTELKEDIRQGPVQEPGELESFDSFQPEEQKMNIEGEGEIDLNEKINDEAMGETENNGNDVIDLNEEEPIKTDESLDNTSENQEQELEEDDTQELEENDISLIKSESSEDENIPFFDTKKESLAPKFISKHKYKEIIFDIVESKEIIQSLVDIRKDFPKKETKLIKEIQSIGKDVELIKEKLANIDKKIFV